MPWHEIDVREFAEKNQLKKTLEAEECAREYYKGLKRHDKRDAFIHAYRVVQILIYHMERAKVIGNLITLEDLDIILAAAFLHDILEDVSWNALEDIEKNFGEMVALLVWVLSRDRRRFSEKIYFSRIADFIFSAIIKLADRLHNLRNMTENLGTEDFFTKKRLDCQINETWDRIASMTIKAMEQYPEYKPIIDEMYDELLKALAIAEYVLQEA
jgi:(p)ppGpp synthase/HD superfamily hydrolase